MIVNIARTDSRQTTKLAGVLVLCRDIL